MKLKKHPFILFELLISILLLTFTTLPFLTQPFKCLKEETKSLIKMELERVAEAALVDIKGELYQNLIPWETLTKKCQPLPDFEKKVQISLPNDIRKNFKQHVHFWICKQKKGQGENELFLIRMRMTFTAAKTKDAELVIKKEFFIKQMPKMI